MLYFRVKYALRVERRTAIWANFTKHMYSDVKPWPGGYVILVSGITHKGACLMKLKTHKSWVQGVQLLRVKNGVVILFVGLNSM